jgi:hypothetical protein
MIGSVLLTFVVHLHVSMTAPGMGSLLELSTQPSTYMYSPFPSNAIDSPSGTVGHHKLWTGSCRGETMIGKYNANRD